MKNSWIAVVTFGFCVSGSSPAWGQADPAPQTLEQKLSQLDLHRNQNVSPIKEVESLGQALLRQYPAPADQGRIYFQMAHVHAQSNIQVQAKAVQKYGRLALEHTFDPNLRATLYSYLSSAALFSPAGSFESLRPRSAEELLKGHREILALNLPARAPELPVVEKWGGDVQGLPEDEVRAKTKKHEGQIKARQEAQLVRDMVAHRDLFLRQLNELYHRPPGGKEELQALATRILGDKNQVNELLAKIDPK
jgi:hypothetical protein